ncbi:hypothetical protein G6O69_16275 [Pseudenhygromyxa sp. WMMC2535]|nr:hypothetical protein [Pseudenhygromyxa sp. WMMC2535]NVB39400.1 hypothetical protein [Pseudenhygromyxa sp. WMMC2535]
MAGYDSNIELNPNGIILGALLFVLVGFGVVSYIILFSEAQTNAAGASE